MIYAMYVAPSARRRGVGLAMMRDLIVRARGLDGLEQLHLWVLRRRETPSPAAALYQACGFVSCGPVVPRDIRAGDVWLDAEYFVLDLALNPS